MLARSTHRSVRRVAVGLKPLLLAIAFAPMLAWGTPVRPPQPADAPDASLLIEQLGSSDFTLREAATTRLQASAETAIDALLAAANQTADLEQALRARWILDSVPLALPTAPPAVISLLEDFSSRSAEGQLEVLSHLVRLEADQGVEALARLARVHPTAGIAQLSAAVIVQEWQPNNPHWPQLLAPVLAGVANSQRPAACLLRELVGFSAYADAPDSVPADCVAHFDRLFEAGEVMLTEAGPVHDMASSYAFPTTGAAGELSQRVTPWLILKCLARAAVQAGQTDRGLSIATRLFDVEDPADREHDVATAKLLLWAADVGLAELVNRLPESIAERLGDEPLLTYAAARCERVQNHPQRATELADTAHDLMADDLQAQVIAATLLAHWGIVDWAEREFSRLLNAPQLSAQVTISLSILRSEFLNDQGRFQAASDSVQALLEGDYNAVQNHRLLKHQGYEPAGLQARRHYFLSRAAHAAGDTAQERRLLETALANDDGELDSLIAFYHLPDLTAADRDWLQAKIVKATAGLQLQIEAEPDNPNPLNEYAWLVANTEGDLSRATRYSKRSLELAFDTASYLDTLAHCYAAAGRPDEAIRCQMVASRREPASPTIQQNLEKFLAIRP